jgi:energy-coupling factor transport system substrate-specific component
MSSTTDVFTEEFMSTTTMSDDRSIDMWSVTTRVIVYAAIGAALYGVAAVFSILIPGTANVSVRPAFALVTFFGFAFGPIVGFFTGFVGNMIADQISGWGLLTSWNWSLANGFAGLLAGVFGVTLARMIPNRLLLAAVAAGLAVIIGFLFVFTDMILGTAETFDAALTANYLPVITSNLIAAVILTPLLVAAWEPIRSSMGR